MKYTLFRCPITDEAIDAYDEHVKHNPDGMPLIRGRSVGYKDYFGLYRIYETKEKIIVEEIK